MISSNNVETKQLPQIEKIQVYGIRWVVLIIFVLYSMSNSMQWVQFSIINDVVVSYYGVSSLWVDWTSMVYMILYIPFVFPASYLLEKLGLRKSVIIGMAGTCLGSWIKVAAVDKDRFYVAFIGQTVVGFSQIFVLAVPARLAAVWFGPSQVSSACSIGVFGNQLGIASGFLFPPIFVNAKSTHDEQTKQFYIMFITVAVYSSALLLCILFFFKDKPPTPPSHAALQQSTEDVDFIGSLKDLTKNKSFMLLLISYGINVGVFYAISTLLNQIVLYYYPNGSSDAGRIGLVIVVAGMLGSVCCGIVLDKYHKFKETTFVVYACALIGMVIYTFTLDKGIYIVYVISAVLGFFMTGLLPVGFELAAELTYPAPEGTSSGLLNCACNFIGIAFTNLYSALFNNVSITWANITMCIALLIGVALLALTSSDLRRQAAQSEKNDLFVKRNFKKMFSDYLDSMHVRVYSDRWVVLGIFVLYSMSNSMQWIQFSIISDVVMHYYGVSGLWVEWTSMIYEVLYIPFVFPASYVLEEMGLRKTVIIGMLGTCLGSWLKVAGVHRDRFIVAFIGQGVVGFSNAFILSVPPRLAAVWFGPAQVSSACSIGVFGNQLGIAFGFVLPLLFINAHSTHEEQTIQFYTMFLTIAGFTSTIFLLILYLFKDRPLSAPSHAVLLQMQSATEVTFLKSIKALMTNISFVLLLIAYGMNVGVFYAISTLLHDVVAHYYDSDVADIHAGRIGLTMVVGGMFGSLFCGIIMDKFHRFKETTLIVYIFALFGMIAFTSFLDGGIFVVYAIAAALGFFMTGLFPLGFELAAELTYPAPEGTSSGLLNCGCNLFGIAFTNMYAEIFHHASPLWANLTLCIALTLGAILLVFTSSERKRQAAQKGGH